MLSLNYYSHYFVYIHYIGRFFYRQDSREYFGRNFGPAMIYYYKELLGGYLMKKMINPFDYAGEFIEHMKKGILLTTKVDNTVNTMTIGWGTMGIEWGRPMFVAYVRESRYTRELLDKNPEFTVNCPVGEIKGQILPFCGKKSGRTVDKVSELGLHLEEPLNISVPGICELPLTLECKVVYRNDQPVDSIPQEIIHRYYPEINGVRDHHIAYYGEIVGAYLITED